jgi:rSAM/selenodomain-associated transferase 2
MTEPDPAPRPPAEAIGVSVVIPALNEEEEVEKTLASVGRDAEAIVVDGGSTDRTVERARRSGATVVSSAAGRARQMNTGAATARGDVLLFLHADTRLPGGWIGAVREAIGEGAVSGRFDVTLRGRSALLPVVAGGMNLRSRLTGIATGDQAIFVRRDVFESLGGFESIPLMEDVELTRRLRRQGPRAPLRLRVDTSGRRWEKHGVLRTIALMHFLRLAYFLGASPHWIARRYADR